MEARFSSRQAIGLIMVMGRMLSAFRLCPQASFLLIMVKGITICTMMPNSGALRNVARL